VLLLSTVKSQHIVNLAQPVIDAAFKSRWLLSALAFAMGHQGTAHTVLLAALDKIPERNASLLHCVAMEVETRLNLVLALTQIFIDSMLHSRTGKFQEVIGIYFIDNTGWVEKVSALKLLLLGGLAPLQDAWRQLRRLTYIFGTLSLQWFDIIANQSPKFIFVSWVLGLTVWILSG
jgi:hypothetical protein